MHVAIPIDSRIEIDKLANSEIFLWNNYSVLVVPYGKKETKTLLEGIKDLLSPLHQLTEK